MNHLEDSIIGAIAGIAIIAGLFIVLIALACIYQGGQP